MARWWGAVANTIMHRFYKAGLGGALLLLIFALGAVEAKKRLDQILVVEASVENFRAEPNGTKIGTLLEGAEIEQIGAEGQWVRFRVEGWIWGPSLEGFEDPEDQGRAGATVEPVSPLQDNLPRLKKLINEKFGVFYGVELNEDLGQLRRRFRVRELEVEEWRRRILTVQREVTDLLADAVDFQEIQIETNRPDGSGEVGSYLVLTTLADLGRYGDDPETWRTHTRFSLDGGENWGAME